MTGTEEKIRLLKRIAHRLNEAQVEWCLGASMMLYFKGIVSEFHDIDLMISVNDVEVVKTILSEMVRWSPISSYSDIYTFVKSRNNII